MSRTKRTLTWVAWGVLVVTRLLALAVPRAPAVVVTPLWVASLVALVWLLVRYNRQLAHWQIVAGIWLAYCGVRWLVTRLPLATSPFLAQNVAGLATILVLDTLLAAFAGLFILAIRRDVSVIYIALASYATGLALLGQVRLSGGVLNWLLGTAATGMVEGFTLVEPLMLAGSCMVALGVVSFLPHLIYLFVREVRGR